MDQQADRPAAVAEESARPQWRVVDHPRGGGYAIMDDNGRYRRHSITGHVSCWSSRYDAECVADLWSGR